MNEELIDNLVKEIMKPINKKIDRIFLPYEIFFATGMVVCVGLLCLIIYNQFIR